MPPPPGCPVTLVARGDARGLDRAVEEAASQRRLEPLDASGDGGLGNPHVRRRAAQRAVRDERHERAQVVDDHNGST